MTNNEAAERLLKRKLVVDTAVQKAIASMDPAEEGLRGWVHALDEDQVPLFLSDVDQALAAERRATVERIRAALAVTPRRSIAAILDAEAER